jgi:hypothetical protein
MTNYNARVLFLACLRLGRRRARATACVSRSLARKRGFIERVRRAHTRALVACVRQAVSACAILCVVDLVMNCDVATRSWA